ncbi:MAG: hypothetical protein DRH30_12700 [Deltaproteobacteria bacterium]|nr:MAG: hypothetical protein DRH30_12700 [Deltaproteobacteria bacterium]
MARGTYGGGQIELHVYAENLDPTDPADQATIDRWKKGFEVASCMLYHATGTKAHFAKVYLYTGALSANDPDTFDARVSNVLESSYAIGHPTVLQDPQEDPDAFLEGTFMKLGKDSFESPFLILHEFGHFGYGLGDEYVGDKPTQCASAQRTGPAVRGHVAGDGEHACIMGAPLGDYNVTRFVPNDVVPGYWVRHGWIVEFCNDNPNNHDPSNGSNHNGMHGDMSCKAVIAQNRGITVATGVAVPEADGDMDACPNVQWPPTTEDSETDCVVDSGPTDPGTPIDDIQDLVFEAGEYGMLSASPADRISLFHFGDSAEQPRFKPMPSVSEALDVIARDLAANPKRAAVQSVLLFSTGREPIPDARKVAGALAKEGARVFSFGLGQDRAALQQLAQRTGGEYFEVDVTDGQRTPAQNAQLVRAQMARAYDRPRFGAPIAIVPREAFVAGPVPIRVEEGSELLKLVFAQTPGSDPEISVHPPHGSAPHFERITSDKGGFKTVSVRKPVPGEWIVSLPAGSLPEVVDLSAYSDNPRVSVGVTGWRRLRLVGETVTLQVVVRAPSAVVELDTAEVRVRPPGGSGVQTHVLSARRDGVHSISFPVTEAGAYDVEVLIRNDGRAKLAGQRFSSEPTPTVPLFERVRRLQIHVAALD